MHIAANAYKKIIVENNILLLQGPVGPFFNHFANFCIAHRANVHKIHFHYGEKIFYKHHSVIYKSSIKQWKDYFIKFVKEHNIKQIFLIGSHKVYHQIAIEYCKRNNIQVIVFEEGYIRSGFITIEENGVNGDTSISKDPNTYVNWQSSNLISVKKTSTLNVFARMYNKISFFYKYSWGLFISQWLVPNYQHHIHAKGIKIFLTWNKFYLSSIYHTVFPFQKEKNTEWLYKNQNNYYIMILQINTDSAITQYSDYSSMEDFIKETMISFAQYAPRDTKLLIKHHPYDRGIHCYKKIIKQLTKQLNLQNRINYVVDLHLDLALELSLGCVLINSTTGYSSIERGIKTIALSKQAVYNIPGLTYQGSLDTFWRCEEYPNLNLYNNFKKYIIYNTQMRGCFYGGEICDFHKKFAFKADS